MTKTPALIVAAVAVLLTAGCGGSGNSGDSGSSVAASTTPSATTVDPSQLPDNQQAPDRLYIDVSITAPDQVDPVNEQLQAAVGEQIIIRVSSDIDDELHVHSTPDHTFKVEPKPNQSFQFKVDVPGKVDVELHKINKTIATITVQ